MRSFITCLVIVCLGWVGYFTYFSSIETQIMQTTVKEYWNPHPSYDVVFVVDEPIAEILLNDKWYVVFEGVDSLEYGPGHWIESQYPGEAGNVVLIGHQRGWDAPFKNINKLRIGEHIKLRFNGIEYTYSVYDKNIVSIDDKVVLAPVPGDLDAVPIEQYITLITDHPKFNTGHMVVVHGQLVAAERIENV